MSHPFYLVSVYLEDPVRRLKGKIKGKEPEKRTEDPLKNLK